MTNINDLKKVKASILGIQYEILEPETEKKLIDSRNKKAQEEAKSTDTKNDISK